MNICKTLSADLVQLNLNWHRLKLGNIILKLKKSTDCSVGFGQLFDTNSCQVVHNSVIIHLYITIYWEWRGISLRIHQSWICLNNCRCNSWHIDNDDYLALKENEVFESQLVYHTLWIVMIWTFKMRWYANHSIINLTRNPLWCKSYYFHFIQNKKHGEIVTWSHSRHLSFGEAIMSTTFCRLMQFCRVKPIQLSSSQCHFLTILKSFFQFVVFLQSYTL